MYVIIVGAGRVGQNLANSLIRQGITVTLIEDNEVKSSEVANEINAMVIKGDATNIKIPLSKNNIET